MNTRKLGRTGPTVAAIGIGAMGMSDFYGPADEGESIATIHAAIDAGTYRAARLDPTVPIEETVGAIAETVQAGCARSPKNAKRPSREALNSEKKTAVRRTDPSGPDHAGRREGARLGRDRVGLGPRDDRSAAIHGRAIRQLEHRQLLLPAHRPELRPLAGRQQAERAVLIEDRPFVIDAGIAQRIVGPATRVQPRPTSVEAAHVELGARNHEPTG
jgi:hypothetical protein